MVGSLRPAGVAPSTLRAQAQPVFVASGQPVLVTYLVEASGNSTTGELVLIPANKVDGGLAAWSLDQTTWLPCTASPTWVSCNVSVVTYTDVAVLALYFRPRGGHQDGD